jgi:hypothetical protein
VFASIAETVASQPANFDAIANMSLSGRFFLYISELILDQDILFGSISLFSFLQL